MELWESGVRGRELLVLDLFIGSAVGRLKVGSHLFGEWDIERDIFQGRAMSQSIFALSTILLNSMLVEAGLGVTFQNADGQSIVVACIVYVDDLVLPATCAVMLQKMLDIASTWAR